jgi:hypothetical protein
MDPRLETRYFHWQCRTVPHLPLSLQDLPIDRIPLDYIHEDCRGINISRTRITDPAYPATLPPQIRSLEHACFQGTTLLHLETTKLGNLVLARCPNLETLGALPRTLRRLTITDCPNFTTLPELPPHLEYLQVSDCPKFTTIPTLPASLQTLSVMNTDVQRLPVVPEDIHAIYIPHEAFEARLLDFQWGFNGLGLPTLRPAVVRRVDLLTSLTRTRFRMNALKEELMMSCWHPRRVEAWLLQGEAVLDNVMGC